MSQKRFFKKKVKKITIICRDKDVLLIKPELTQWLKKRDIKSSFFLQSEFSKKRLTSKADVVLVLGGDGTYLCAVNYAQKQAIPVLGINMGSLGFLTIHTKDQLYEYLEKTIKGSMRLVQRNLLDVTISTAQKKLVGLALNDVVIERGAQSKLIDLSIFLKKKFIYSVKADGLIIASSTGSTAYNLAAGGPILHPKLEAILVTPICPHILTHRPVIFSSEDILEFQLKSLSRGAYITIDGKRVSGLSRDSFVRVRKAAVYHQALRDPSHSNFTFLRDKFNFFTRIE